MYSFGATLFPVNLPVWSLFFELWVNLIYALAAPFCGRRTLGAAMCASLVWLLAVSWPPGLSQLGVIETQFWGGFPRAGFSFLAGLTIFLLGRDGRLPRLRVPLAGLLVGLAIILGVSWVQWIGVIYFELVCILVLFPALVILGIDATLGPQTATLAKHLGALSYPIYVTHYPLLDMMERIFLRLTPLPLGPVALAASLAIIVAVNWLMLKLLDEPLRRWLGGLLAPSKSTSAPQSSAG